MTNEIVFFKSHECDITLPVSVTDDTGWLSASHMAQLFKREESTIRRNIINIFKEEELDRKRNVQKMHVPFSDKLVPFYTLDVIISVGYRVKSKRGVEFRRWANNVLKDYIIKGYAINEKRLEVLNKKIEIQNNLISTFATIAGIEAKDVLEVIDAYSLALDMLDDYDHQSIDKPKGTKTITYLTEDYCIHIINNMRQNYNLKLFGKERSPGLLKGILDQIQQYVFNTELYPSLEEKAANLLYMLVKDHIYYDGNKRIAAVLFLEFLNQNLILYDKNNIRTLSNSTLVAMTLMIACSSPNEKDMFISIIMNLISNKSIHIHSKQQ